MHRALFYFKKLKLGTIFKNSTLLFVLVFFLSACNGSYPPVEADDFGYPKYTIYASGQNVTGEEANQLADWELTGYYYNGASSSGGNMTIMVYNPVYDTSTGTYTTYLWAPWLCDGEESVCQNMSGVPFCIDSNNCSDPSNCPPSTAPCTYTCPSGSTDCSVGSFCPLTSTDSFCCNGDPSTCESVLYETFPNAPCTLQQGQGLYLLVTLPSAAPTYGTNPNTYPNVNRTPYTAGFYTKGLWYPSAAYQNNEPAMGYYGPLDIPPQPPQGNAPYPDDASDYIGGYAYLKIVDRYYEDNAGFFYVALKSGFSSIVPPPIETIMNFLTTALNETAQTIFTRIVNETDFRLSLKSLLVIYIVVCGLMYMGGLTDMTSMDLASMFIRLIIVIQLTTSDASWNLFNSYFFNFFTNGLGEMVNIVTSTLTVYGGDSKVSVSGTNQFAFFDSLFGLIFSYETNVKNFALIASFPCGFIVTIMIYVALAIFAIAIAQSAMIYLLAYMAIDLLIVVAPIFICFMLFKPTKPLFEGWLNMFCSYFLQAVVVMAAIALLAQLIVQQIYTTLGFKACYDDWIVVNFVGISFVVSKAWQVCPWSNSSTNGGNYSSYTTDSIAIPGYGYNDPSNTDYYCEPYECVDNRYVNLPFLNTDTQSDLIGAIQSMPSSSANNTQMLYCGVLLLLYCYLMMKFNEIVPSLASGLSGGSFQSAVGEAGKSAMGNIASAFSGTKNAVLKLSTGKNQAQREESRRKAMHLFKRKALTGVSEYITDPLKRGAKFVGKGTASAFVAAAGGAVWAGKKADKFVEAGLDIMAQSTRSERLGERARLAEIRKKQRQEIVQTVDKQLEKYVKGYKTGKNYAEQVRKVSSSAAKAALKVGAKTLTSTASGAMKAAGMAYNTGKAIAPKSLYSLGGFIKDAVIPPGSLVGFGYTTPEDQAARKKEFLKARNAVRQRDAKEEKDAYDQFHRERWKKKGERKKKELEKWHKKKLKEAKDQALRDAGVNKDSFNDSFAKAQEKIDKLRAQENAKRAAAFKEAYQKEYDSSVLKAKYLPDAAKYTYGILPHVYQYMLDPEKAQEIYEEVDKKRQVAIDKQMKDLRDKYISKYEKESQKSGFNQKRAEQLLAEYQGKMHSLNYAHYYAGKKLMREEFKNTIDERHREEKVNLTASSIIKNKPFLNQQKFEKRWEDIFSASVAAADRSFTNSAGKIDLARIEKEKQLSIKASKEVYNAQRTIDPKKQKEIDEEYQDRLSNLKYQQSAKGYEEYRNYSSKGGIVERLEYDPMEEGYKYNKSHREDLVDKFKKQKIYGLGISLGEMERRAAEFDRKRKEEYGDSIGMALFKAGAGGVGKAILGKKGTEELSKIGNKMVESIKEALADPKIKKQQEENRRLKRERKARIKDYKAQKLKQEQTQRYEEYEQQLKERRQAKEWSKIQQQTQKQDTLKKMQGTHEELMQAVEKRKERMLQKRSAMKGIQQELSAKQQKKMVLDEIKTPGLKDKLTKSDRLKAEVKSLKLAYLQKDAEYKRFIDPATGRIKEGSFDNENLIKLRNERNALEAKRDQKIVELYEHSGDSTNIEYMKAKVRTETNERIKGTLDGKPISSPELEEVKKSDSVKLSNTSNKTSLGVLEAHPLEDEATIQKKSLEKMTATERMQYENKNFIKQDQESSDKAKNLIKENIVLYNQKYRDLFATEETLNRLGYQISLASSKLDNNGAAANLSILEKIKETAALVRAAQDNNELEHRKNLAILELVDNVKKLKNIALDTYIDKNLEIERKQAQEKVNQEQKKEKKIADREELFKEKELEEGKKPLFSEDNETMERPEEDSITRDELFEDDDNEERESIEEQKPEKSGQEKLKEIEKKFEEIKEEERFLEEVEKATEKKKDDNSGESSIQGPAMNRKSTTDKRTDDLVDNFKKLKKAEIDPLKGKKDD